MNRVFNESFLRQFNRLALPLVLVWSFTTGAGIFLSNTTIERFSFPLAPFFEIFHFSKKFAISRIADGDTTQKTVTTKTLVPAPHRIQAIYRSSSSSFVTIYDGKESTIVPLGGKYKQVFRLIALNDSTATFKGYGKAYRLRLGYDDNLSREEVTTQAVYEQKPAELIEEKTMTIPYTTVAAQINNLQNIWKMINISETRDGSKITGFRVNAIDSTSIFGQLGILQGDTIEAVNNTKLESYADALNAYSQIPHLRSIRITVLRNNLKKDIVYEITR